MGTYFGYSLGIPWFCIIIIWNTFEGPNKETTATKWHSFLLRPPWQWCKHRPASKRLHGSRFERTCWRISPCSDTFGRDHSRGPPTVCSPGPKQLPFVGECSVFLGAVPNVQKAKRPQIMRVQVNSTIVNP